MAKACQTLKFWSPQGDYAVRLAVHGGRVTCVEIVHLPSGHAVRWMPPEPDEVRLRDDEVRLTFHVLEPSELRYDYGNWYGEWTRKPGGQCRHLVPAGE